MPDYIPRKAVQHGKATLARRAQDHIDTVSQLRNSFIPSGFFTAQHWRTFPSHAAASAAGTCHPGSLAANNYKHHCFNVSCTLTFACMSVRFIWLVFLIAQRSGFPVPTFNIDLKWLIVLSVVFYFLEHKTRNAFLDRRQYNEKNKCYCKARVIVCGCV